MKQNKLIVPIAIIFILCIVAFMTYDFFWSSKKSDGNIYEYNLDDFTKVAPELVSYNETQTISINLEKVKGICTDNKDKIYVSGLGKVLVFNSKGEFLKEIITNIPSRCISFGNNQLFIGAENHVEIWNTDGNRIDSWEAANEKSLITSIAVGDSSVFVSDAGNKIIYHYNLAGDLLNEIGRKDSAMGIPGFVIPSPYFDVAMGRDGELWAVNSGRHQFEAYNPDGRLITSWKKTSMHLDGFSGCCNPSHFVILEDGSFLTSEKGIVRVKIHDQTGKFSSVVATPDQFDKGTTGLDLALDSEGRVIILDPSRKQVRIFEKK